MSSSRLRLLPAFLLAVAKGAYRAPDSDSSGYTFLLLRNVRRVPAGTTVGALLPNRDTTRP